ncbi:MAG: polysaccharide biosynthesis protein [Spirulinaceae cyanobacterium SM2_1_0]|nr:polysaccharide biosynthesis protein [Spirulinaceae cyanobacterium SM2_1_0]
MRRFLPKISVYRLGHLILDGTIAWLAGTLAFWLRFEGSLPPEYRAMALWLPLLAIPSRLLVQSGFGLYQQIWRLFGIKDTIMVVCAVSVYSLLLLAVTDLALPLRVPIGVVALDWSFCLMEMVAMRYARRWSMRRSKYSAYSYRLPQSERRRVLLIGAGIAGGQLVQEIRQNRQLNLEIVGFVDDDQTKIGRRVEGIKVLGKTSECVAIANHHEADEVFICMPSARASQIRKLVNLLRGTPLKLKVLPSQAELLRDRSLAPQVRDIQIQDILGRAEIHLDFERSFSRGVPSARAQVRDRVVLVTGAGGTIGAEICRQLAPLQPRQLLLLGRGENSIFNIDQELRRRFPDLALTPLIADIRHRLRLQHLFTTYQPELIFHAAAHKHVPLMEGNPTEALENNAIATAQLAQLAAQCGVTTFVAISTDKAVDPCNFMGLSKRLAELFVRANADDSATRFLVVRFGNVLGSRGSVVPIFKDQIARGGPVTVTDRRVSRYFMTTPEASQLVIQSLAVGESGQTLILDMGDPVNIYDLAEQMIHLAGFHPEVEIPIAVTGLRPGEKLHEALIATSETTIPTTHPQILAVQSLSPSRDWSQQTLAQLTAAIDQATEPTQLWAIAQNCVRQFEVNPDLTPE